MRRLLAIAAALAGATVSVAAQGGTHVLVISGLSGEPAAAKRFAQSALPVITAAKEKWGVADSSLLYLAEDPAADKRITGKATSENISAAFARLAKRAAPGDLVLIVLIGHGSGERDESKVNIFGPDPTAHDYATMLLPLTKQRVVFVVAASGSGDFLPVLTGKDRVIVTATKSALERNESLFSLWMGRGLTDDAADADKDGMISVLEAFTFARTELARVYELAGLMQTEHPQLDDNGDGKPTAEPALTGTDDGAIAAQSTFGGVAASNPRVAALLAERRLLEREVAALREKKGIMPQAEYEKEFERLLLAIAEKSAAIQALTPVKKP